ncbi:hypothetical protein VTO42DRAFT_6771 [Malbranchea cinnamomea]
MQFPVLLLLPLLHGYYAWAACIPNWTPSIDSLGTLQVLKYNDLSSENNGTAAVLAHKRQTYARAESTCSTIGESLYQIPETLDNSLTELQHQLDYLVFNRDLPPDGFLWVQSQRDSSSRCVAYAYGRKQVSNVSCDTELPVLCTSKPAPTTQDNTEPEEYSKISTKAGDYSVTGYRDGRSFRFLGIPYADPPVGNLRLMPPRPYSGPKDVKATSFGPSCMQGSGNETEYSEDCLYINVYTPVLPAGKSCAVGRRPVAVWLYGGAFLGGSSSSIVYDGGNFASRNDVVVVTLNYRLGALGFLATDSVLPGSQGIQDQILALQWVKKHIAAFGGDPSRVTIFGESAGGQSVVALLSSSAAQGLFAAAISQSSPVSLPWFTRDVYTEFITPQVSSDVGCNETKSEKELIACLQSVPATEFLHVDMSTIASRVNSGYLHSTTLVANIEPFLPMIDDSNSGVIDDQFHVLLSEDKLPNRVPAIFTIVADESAAWLNIVPELGSSQEALEMALSIAFPRDLADQMIDSGIFRVNSSHPDGVRIALANFLTASNWICPQSYLLDLANNSFPMLYEGVFTRGYTRNSSSTAEICVPNAHYNATCHAADVLPVWGSMNLLQGGRYYDDEGLPHSQLMNDVFGSFFRTHDPNPDVDMLKIRGPAYSTTYRIFAEQGYEVRLFNSSIGDLNEFGFPPSHTDGPLVPEQCAVFESYGYTFERAKFEA